MGWFFGKRAEAQAEPQAADTPTYANTIDAGTVVKGDMRGRGFRIDGTVDGLVEADGPVQVGVSGIVTGCIRATDLIILGRVEGDIEASGHLAIGPRGRVIGDIAVQSMGMDKGGIFRGVSRMVDEGGSAESLPAPALEQGSASSESSAPSEAPSANEALNESPPPLLSQKRPIAVEHDSDVVEDEAELEKTAGG